MESGDIGRRRPKTGDSRSQSSEHAANPSRSRGLDKPLVEDTIERTPPTHLNKALTRRTREFLFTEMLDGEALHFIEGANYQRPGTTHVSQSIRGVFAVTSRRVVFIADPKTGVGLAFNVKLSRVLDHAVKRGQLDGGELLLVTRSGRLLIRYLPGLEADHAESVIRDLLSKRPPNTKPSEPEDVRSGLEPADLVRICRQCGSRTNLASDLCESCREDEAKVPTMWRIVILDPGRNNITIIKSLRELPGFMSLEAAQAVLKNTPCVLVSGLDLEEARRVDAKFRKSGAITRVEPDA